MWLAVVQRSLGFGNEGCGHHVAMSTGTDGNAVGDISSNRLSVEDFDVVKVIGRGAFGEVQLVSDGSQ